MRLLFLLLLVSATIAHVMAETVANESATLSTQPPAAGQSVNAMPPALPAQVDASKPPATRAPIDPVTHNALFSKRTSILAQLAPVRQVVAKDPEITQLREQLAQLQKVYQDKEETLLRAHQEYPGLKAKLDAIDQQLNLQSGGFDGMPGANPFPYRRSPFNPDRSTQQSNNPVADPNATNNF